MAKDAAVTKLPAFSEAPWNADKYKNVEDNWRRQEGPTVRALWRTRRVPWEIERIEKCKKA